MKIDPSKIKLTERDLEEYLWNNPYLFDEKLDNESITRWLARQYHVPSGVIDLLGVTTRENIAVIELKNKKMKFKKCIGSAQNTTLT